MRSTIVSVAAALALLPFAATAQDPAPSATPQFGEEVEVSEVLLDVLVTDRDGNVIVGLGEDDFEVTENGRRVDLTEVTFYSNRPRLDAAGAQVEAPASERYFVLFFDDQRPLTEVPAMMTRQLEASRRAKEWLAKLQLDDYVAVASFDTSLAVHTDFTRDRAEIAKAIDDAVTGKNPSGNWPSRMPPEGGPSLLRQLPRGRELVDATVDVREALEVIADAMQPLVGRKNLVLFSSGFGRVRMGSYLPDPRYEPPMQQALNDANVAVYAIDLTPAGTDSALSSSLSLLADQTGGRYFPNVVNFVTPLEEVATEASGYYLLAYQSPHPRGESGFQEVRVTLKNPEFRVKARRGYAFGTE